MAACYLYFTFNPIQNTLASDIDQVTSVCCTRVTDPDAFYSTYIAGKDTSSQYLNIITMNIRSINKNLDDFLIFITRLKINPDILVLTECWTQFVACPPLVKGYSSAYTKTNYNQNDGVIVYIRTNLHVSTCEISISEANCLAISIEDMYILAIYRPPGFRNPRPFLESLSNFLESTKYQRIILTGDLNIDLLPDSRCSYSQEYQNILALNAIIPAINCPTRELRCLDHFAIKNIKNLQTFVFEPTITDHSPILLNIKLSNKIVNSPASNIKYNYKAMEENLKQLNWGNFFNSTDTNFSANFLVNKIKDIIIRNTSISTISKKLKPIKPWINQSIIKCMKKRDRLHRIFKTSPTDLNKISYTQYRNICNSILKTLKRQYLQGKLKQNAGNSKGTWDTIKEICNLPTKNATPLELLSIMNTPEESLTYANKYFTSIGQNLATSIINKSGGNHTSNIPDVSSNAPLNSLLFYPTDIYEVNKVIVNLKSNSAAGHDKITTFFIKQFKDYLIEPIAQLVNLSMSTGVFPDILKKAVITPVHKSGDKKAVSNYRPISLLSILSKIVEKIVNSRLTKFLEQSNLLAINQYGFRAKRSTLDAVLEVTDCITKCLDKGRKCIGIFLDLQKAFDTVSIPILLDRLSGVGVRGVALDWFKSYLNERQQCVKIGNVASEYCTITYGVPQGSVLGPTLFLTYINSLCKLTPISGRIFCFADDTVVLFEGSDWDETKSLAEEGLQQITSWLEDNLLTINTAKTKYVCFSISSKNSPSRFFKLTIHTYPCNRNSRQVTCNCDVLSREAAVKYLGITLDEHLNWSTHIQNTSNKIKKLIPLFRNLRDIAPIETVMMVYKSLCIPVMTYCICAWGGAGKTFLLQLERAHRTLLKTIFRKPYRYPTDKLYKECNLLNVRQQYIFSIIAHFHSKINPFTINDDKRITKFPMTFTNTCFAKSQFKFSSSYAYNIFSKAIKGINIYKIQKYDLTKTLKKWLASKGYDETENILKIKK